MFGAAIKLRGQKRAKRLRKRCKKASQQHQEFPSGLPSKYYPGPMLLNFSDRTRTGVFNMVWPLARGEQTNRADKAVPTSSMVTRERRKMKVR